MTTSLCKIHQWVPTVLRAPKNTVLKTQLWIQKKGSPKGQKWTELSEHHPRERITILITLVLEAGGSYSGSETTTLYLDSMFTKECSGYDMAPHVIYLQWTKHPHLPKSSINHCKFWVTHQFVSSVKLS